MPAVVSPVSSVQRAHSYASQSDNQRDSVFSELRPTHVMHQPMHQQIVVHLHEFLSLQA